MKHLLWFSVGAWLVLCIACGAEFREPQTPQERANFCAQVAARAEAVKQAPLSRSARALAEAQIDEWEEIGQCAASGR